MESMALVPPTPLALAYVGVFLIKSAYIKQNQCKKLVNCNLESFYGRGVHVGEITAVKKSHKLQVDMKTKPWENKDDTKQKNGYCGVSFYVLCKE